MLVLVLLLSAALPLSILLMIGILARRDRRRTYRPRPVVVVMPERAPRPWCDDGALMIDDGREVAP